MLYGYSWSLDTTSYSERVRKTSLKEFVPRRSTHSLLLFHLHFHLYCIAVKIFELLRSCDHKFYMKTLKPQNVFFDITLLSQLPFSFLLKRKIFAHLFSLSIGSCNCKGSRYIQVKVKSTGFGIRDLGLYPGATT